MELVFRGLSIYFRSLSRPIVILPWDQNSKCFTQLQNSYLAPKARLIGRNLKIDRQEGEISSILFRFERINDKTFFLVINRCWEHHCGIHQSSGHCVYSALQFDINSVTFIHRKKTLPIAVPAISEFYCNSDSKGIAACKAWKASVCSSTSFSN